MSRVQIDRARILDAGRAAQAKRNRERMRQVARAKGAQHRSPEPAVTVLSGVPGALNRLLITYGLKP